MGTTKAYIDNEDLLKDESHDKKIRLALNRLQKAAQEITDLGYTIYIAGHGNVNIMNQDEYSNNMDYSQDCIVATITLDKTDVGDW